MQGKPVAKTKQGRTHLMAFLSADDGRTWSGGLLLDERNSVSYPDGDEGPDGRVFVTYDRNRKADREILVATFTEADVAAGKLVDSRSALRLPVTAARLKSRAYRSGYSSTPQTTSRQMGASRRSEAALRSARY